MEIRAPFAMERGQPHWPKAGETLCMHDLLGIERLLARDVLTLAADPAHSPARPAMMGLRGSRGGFLCFSHRRS